MTRINPARFRPALDSLDDRLPPAGVGFEDPAFGYNGTTGIYFYHSDSDAPYETAKSTALAGDGRLLVLGSIPVTRGDNDLTLVRLLANGQPDPLLGSSYSPRQLSFGVSGSTTEQPVGVAVTPGGRILVAAGVAPAGEAPRSVGLLRLSPLGTIDPTFGADGRRADVPAGYAADFNGSGMAIGPDGRVVVGVTLTKTEGKNGRADFGAVRFLPDGTVDSGFGTNGWAVVGFGANGRGNDRLAGVAVAPDGAVVLAGTTDYGGDDDFGVIRLTPEGRPDDGFGVLGRATVGFARPGNGNDQAAAVALAPGGGVIVAGAAGVANNPDFGVVRLTSGGEPDPGFGGNGKVMVEFNVPGSSWADRANAVAVQPDGRVVVAGVAARAELRISDFYSGDQVVGRTGFAVARLHPDGSRDAVFGDGGRQILAPRYEYSSGAAVEAVTAVAVRPDGRILLAGDADTRYGYDSSRTSPDLRVVQLVGGTGLTTGVAVGGAADGTAAVFAPGPDGSFRPGPVLDAVGPGAARVARGDVDADGVEDTILGDSPCGPPVAGVVSGRTGERVVEPQPAFEQSFTGGVFVVAADLDGDGRAEVVVTPDQGGGPRVRVFGVAGGVLTERNNFFGIDDPDFRGGARAALGDITGDGTPDLVVGAGFGGGPRVAVFDGRGLAAGFGTPGRVINDFLAFPGADAARLRNGVFVAAGDLDGDGYAEVIAGAGPGGAPRVVVLDGPLLVIGDLTTAVSTPVASFYSGDVAARGGVRVAVKDVDGDARADLVTGSGAGESPRVRVYLGGGVSGTAPTIDQEFDPFGSQPPDGVFVG